MSAEKHAITYPGFAEGLSARGLYDDIKEAYTSDYSFHMLPFYEEDSATGNRTIYSIAKHIDMLQTYMDDLDGDITILGKCGGSRVVSSIDDDHLSRVEKMILFNPPWTTGRTRLEERYEGWGGKKQLDGSWFIPRDKSGTPKYIVTPGYLEEAGTARAMDSYRRVAAKTRLFIVRGMNDNVIPPIDVSRIEGATGIDIEGGDHHLTGEYRQKTIGKLAVLFTQTAEDEQKVL